MLEGCFMQAPKDGPEQQDSKKKWFHIRKEQSGTRRTNSLEEREWGGRHPNIKGVGAKQFEPWDFWEARMMIGRLG